MMPYDEKLPIFMEIFCPFLGAFAKYWKATISLVMSLCLSARLSVWNNSVPTKKNFNEIRYLSISTNSFQKIKLLFEYETNNECFT